MNDERARLPFLFSHQANLANSATETAPAIETRSPAPAAIKSHVTGIGVAGTVVTTWIGPRARIASGNVAWPPALQFSAVNVLLRNGQEGLLALRSVNPDGIDEAEAQLFLRMENRGAASCEEHCADACSRTGSCANRGTFAPVRSGADQCAEPGGGGNRRGVLPVRSSARAFPQLGKNRDLTAIHDGQVRELDSQLGGALDAAGFAHVFDVANDRSEEHTSD